MIDYDQDFGHTDMEMTWDGERRNQASLLHGNWVRMVWRINDAQSRYYGDYVERYL